MKTFFKAILILVIVISLAIFIAVIAGAVVLNGYATSKVDDDLINGYAAAEQTLFYRAESTADSEDFYNFVRVTDARLDSGVKYKYVSYDKLPDQLIKAFIAIEDKRFYSHHGIDYKRSLGAVVNYVFHGQKSFGGSTITQQLVKNLTGEDEPSISRKLKEAFCAMELEQRLDKSEIMEKYLNVINLSHGCFGVGAAAEYYFSKDICDLTLCECASIAAITNNPARYSPINHPEDHVKRRNTVLMCMRDQGYISEKEYKTAKSMPLSLKLSVKGDSAVNSWYIDMVVEDVSRDLAKKYDISKQMATWLLYRGGYRIYTAMDAQIQSIVENYYADEYNFPMSDDGEMPQSSVIVINPKNGDILAVAGAVGPKIANRIQSYATGTKRPSGSVIKPLSVYAPALDMGLIKWSSILSDTPIKEATDTNPAWPANANGQYAGNVTLRYAIDQSLNTVAIKTLEMLGNKTSFDFLKDKLHIKSLDENADMGEASLALGQMSRGVTLREIVAAYSIFDSGVMSEARSYFKVTDSSGVVVLDNSPKRERVISEQSAAIMTKLLESVVKNGTAKGKVSLTEKCEVAGKSGTTQNSADRYFIGYTPTLLAGVWSGFEYPRSLEEFGGNFSVSIWDELMNIIYDKTAYGSLETTFTVPRSVQPLSFDSKTGNMDPTTLDDQNSEIGWFDRTRE